MLLLGIDMAQGRYRTWVVVAQPVRQHGASTVEVVSGR